MDVDQQLIEARALPLDDDARAAYLGGAWRAVRAAAAASAASRRA
jgi:hypothetical protein